MWCVYTSINLILSRLNFVEDIQKFTTFFKHFYSAMLGRFLLGLQASKRELEREPARTIYMVCEGATELT